MIPKRAWPLWTAPGVIALLAFVAVVAAIDPAGDYPDAAEGPGLTIDEVFNVEEGVRLAVGLRDWVSREASLREIFGDQRDLPPNSTTGYHNPDHPPLGRIWLGVWHEIAETVAPPRNHQGPFVTACARVGSAAAYSLTVFLCGWAAAIWYGQLAGAIAAISLVLMPRVFGHAHLAALESCIGLAYTAAVLAVARFWRGDAPPSWRVAAITGITLGVAMLTKIQGVLIPMPVAIWALAHWRFRAIKPLLIWAMAGLAVFFLWPWLWLGGDPLHRFLQYLGRTTERSIIYVWYFGQRYADRNVPWHYPAVMFLVTVPLGLQALATIGLFAGTSQPWKQRHAQVLLGAIAFPLVLFSLPHIAVYDGARLFLIVFPLWSIFIGRGGAVVWSWLRLKWSIRLATVVAACFLAAQTWGLVSVWPCFLSYYNLAIGGLRGANALGLELDYWGEAVTRDFLEEVARRVPEGAHVDVAPVLLPAEFQLEELLRQSPVLRRRGVVLHAYDGDSPHHSDYLLIFRRLADLSPEMRKMEATGAAGAEVTTRREGVILAALYSKRVP